MNRFLLQNPKEMVRGIEVESLLGHGTTFSLYLPLAQDRVEKSNTNKEDAPMRKGNARVLFIDDDEYIVQMIGLVLKKLGYSITCFQESSEGLHWYKNYYNLIDIIILDMVMPGLPARKVFEQFMEINPKAIIVLTSGYSINKDVETLLKLGAKDFLKKPFEIAELTSVIANSLGAH